LRGKLRGKGKVEEESGREKEDEIGKGMQFVPVLANVKYFSGKTKPI
jgi:hypothetical protein